jgi:tetratricopeptide (TPR) repeat protein
MILRLQQVTTNRYPIRGFFIRSEEPAAWLQAIQETGLTLDEISTYMLEDPLDGKIWGCLIVTPEGYLPPERYVLAQQVCDMLFIPSHTDVYPHITSSDHKKLFGGNLHIFHPHLGLIKCSTVVDWNEHLILPTEAPVTIVAPAPKVFIPSVIRQFVISAPDAEDTITKMESTLFPEQKQVGKPPLNTLEKLLLFVLRFSMGRNAEQEIDSKEPGRNEGKASWLKLLDKWLGGKKLAEKLATIHQNLEERNQKEMNKLLDLFAKNPDRALKYAIPIDQSGASRGGSNGSFRLQERWFNFGLFGSANGTGGPTVAISDSSALWQAYQKATDEYLAAKDYRKAAFIQLKLLKNSNRAAEILKDGKFYVEAAALFKKENKLRSAAVCYMLANMPYEAIELYKLLYAYETLGDIYTSLDDKESASQYYEMVATGYINGSQFIKAASFVHEKMNDYERARQLLLRGWNEGREPVEALTEYFKMSNQAFIEKDLETFYKSEISVKTGEHFLHVIKKLYPLANALPSNIRAIFYELLSDRAPDKQHLLKELKYLNPEDSRILKDVIAFKYQASKTRGS